MMLRAQHACLSKGLNPCISQRSNLNYRHKRCHAIIRACSQDEYKESNSDQDGMNQGLVDSNMSMLRKRINQLRSKNLTEITEFEKEHCATLFESNNIEILGLVQFDDLIAKPRIAIGLTVMTSFCVPVSVLVIMLHLMDIAKMVFDRGNVSETKDDLD